MVKESPEFTIENLQPQTVYCVQARVLLFATWNRSSSFTDVLCEKTRPGESFWTDLMEQEVIEALHWDW